MAKVIIGIHGLANKPNRDRLKDGWIKAIKEGLVKNTDMTEPEFSFEMVYWAHRMYRSPLHYDQDFDFDDLYNTQPYIEATAKLQPHADSFFDTLRRVGSNAIGTGLDFVRNGEEDNSLADWVLRSRLKDLAFYYDTNRAVPDTDKESVKVQARALLRADLRGAVEAHEGDQIMLIAHSMGSIIAYDALRDLGREKPEFAVDHFVTIGSPLGLSYVKEKIKAERRYNSEPEGRLRSPTVVRKRWKNYADRRDPVAVDTHLSDDFSENATGIQVEDDLVINAYVDPSLEPNRHKSYGYLRAPEVSDHIKAFLEE